MFPKPYRQAVTSTSQIPDIWYEAFPRDVQRYMRKCKYCETVCRDDDRVKCESCGAPLDIG